MSARTLTDHFAHKMADDYSEARDYTDKNGRNKFGIKLIIKSHALTCRTFQAVPCLG